MAIYVNNPCDEWYLYITSNTVIMNIMLRARVLFTYPSSLVGLAWPFQSRICVGTLESGETLAHIPTSIPFRQFEVTSDVFVYAFYVYSFTMN